MLFCSNCGAKLIDGSKFCNFCGTPVNTVQTGNTSESANQTPPQPPQGNTERQQEYAGKLIKCPNCGEVLASFITNCPSCGYELRGNTATDSVMELYRELNRTTTPEQKDFMIRNFPIPNSKEDIIEFMILASTNFIGEDDRNIYEAWLAKFEQAYQKAEVLFKQDSDFEKIQQIYDNCQNNISTERHRKIGKFTVDAVIRNITVCVGIILMIVAVIVDRVSGDASFIELSAYILLIVSASFLFKRGATVIDYAVSALSGLLTLALSLFLENGAMGGLCGVIVLIIVVVNYFKSINKSKNQEGK